MAENNNTFVDLGLPSGTLWASENAVLDGKEHFTFDEACENFGELLPSKENWLELFENCSRKWDRKRKGCKLTGPNGNSVFLPAEGSRYGSALYGAGRSGYYWSSSPNSSNVDNAYGVYFDSGRVNHQNRNYRYGGFCVRLCKKP